MLRSDLYKATMPLLGEQVSRTFTHNYNAKRHNRQILNKMTTAGYYKTD